MPTNNDANDPLQQDLSLELTGLKVDDRVTLICREKVVAEMSLLQAMAFPDLLQDEIDEHRAYGWRLLNLAESSNINSAMHHMASARVRVEFRNGAVYDYFGVTPAHIDEWQEAISAGSYLNTVLKKAGLHPCLKVEIN